MSNTAQNRQVFGFRLDLASGVPVYRQIIDQVLGGIASGTWTAATNSPPSGRSRSTLPINPNTVVRAYRELEIRGVLETQQGTGTFISRQKVETRRRGAPARAHPDSSPNSYRAPAPPASRVEELMEQLNDRCVRYAPGRGDNL